MTFTPVIAAVCIALVLLLVGAAGAVLFALYVTTLAIAARAEVWDE